MTLVLDRLISGYQSTFVDTIDHRSDDWLLSRSIFVPLGIIACYLYFVKICGPKFMEKREPFKLDRIMIVYNIIQILLSFYVFWEGTKMWWNLQYNIMCQPVDRNDNEGTRKGAQMVYMYYVIKITDLLDTVFFVLRKKTRQISFLHVYHHAGMIFCAYLGSRYSLNGHFTMLGVINSFVHVVMYMYYLVTALWPESKENLWWKKHITTLQLVQFYLLVAHESLPLFQPNCNVQKFWCYLLVIQYTFMIVLFTDFYKKAYPSKKEKTT